MRRRCAASHACAPARRTPPARPPTPAPPAARAQQTLCRPLQDCGHHQRRQGGCGLYLQRGLEVSGGLPRAATAQSYGTCSRPAALAGCRPPASIHARCACCMAGCSLRGTWCPPRLGRVCVRPPSFVACLAWLPCRETDIPYARRMDKYAKYSFLPQHLEVGAGGEHARHCGRPAAASAGAATAGAGAVGGGAAAYARHPLCAACPPLAPPPPPPPPPADPLVLHCQLVRHRAAAHRLPGHNLDARAEKR